MNRVVAILSNPAYMGAAGMFLGVNTAIYHKIKNEHLYNDFLSIYSCMFGCAIGGSVGLLVPMVIPIWAASIPCYATMKYLNKKQLL